MIKSLENTNDSDIFDFETDAPILSKIEKKNCFEAPEDYFEVLPMMIQNSCNQPKANIILALFRRALRPAYIVSTVCVILLVFFVSTQDNSFVANILNFNSNKINEEMVEIENLSEIEELKVDNNTANIDFSDFSKDEINNYIDDNYLDATSNINIE